MAGPSEDFRAGVREALAGATLVETVEQWDLFVRHYGAEAEQALILEDRYYLLTTVLGRKDAFHPWLFARCREVEAAPDAHLDLWAREHYKSTLITFAGGIQEIVRDPNITIGIFSHTKPIARKFLTQIKEELERNERLKDLFPGIFWRYPHKDSPRWSEEKGIVVIRESNPKEATVEAHGLVDGQPTSAHFSLRIYDDVVTRESVSTPEQVKKTTEAWELSDNLGAAGPTGRARAWHIGTRYSFADTYSDILEKKVLTARVFPATDDGTRDGNPVFLSPEQWEKKKSTQGRGTLAAQMLQNPAAGNEAMFDVAWLKFTDIRPRTLNVYIMVDPASSKKKGSDRTAMAVIAIDAAKNKYLVDGYHHRMSLSERWQRIKGLRRKWRDMPGVQLVRVGYERFGLQDALEYFEEKMRSENDSFEIVELAWPNEGPGSKYDRIQRLEPDFKAGRVLLAAQVENETRNQRMVREAGESFRILAPVKQRDENNALYSINSGFLDEYMLYPFSRHDDFLDAMSRIYDMEPMPPTIIDDAALEPEVFSDGA